MIQFEKQQLSNGLRVIVHRDESTPMVAVNVLYDVGARDEDVNKTGFAHLFEHLMFSGSVNIPNYDMPLQMAGGENNAYTTNDITNYYLQLPKENLETALWLESDRMLSLAFSKDGLEVQRKVVCEEFKEHYINKPYGDVWQHIREMAYTTHPYQWMTIGKQLSHIEDATLEDVKAFFKKHYNPQNAILCIAGDVTMEEILPLVEKWFGAIPAGEKYVRNLPQEPKQTQKRTKTVTASVPVDAFYKVWHIAPRLDKGYYITDILTEILGSGASAVLHVKLVKELRLFSDITCYHTGSLDAGLMVICGRLSKGVTMEAAEAAVDAIVADFRANGITQEQYDKALNKVESMIVFEDLNLLSRANNLAFYELLGDVDMMNHEMDNYTSLSLEEIKAYIAQTFVDENSSVLYYLSDGTTTNDFGDEEDDEEEYDDKED
jgi:zinc protease